MLSVRRAALAAGIALAILRAQWIFGQIHVLSVASGIPVWRFVLPLIVNLLLFIPLPVMLLVLYRSKAVLNVAEPWRRIAGILAILYGAVIVAPALYHWKTSLATAVGEIQIEARSTVAAKLGLWLSERQAAQQLWGLVPLCASVTFLLVLIAFYVNTASSTGPTRTWWLREVAALTSITGGISLLWGTAWRAWFLARAIYPPEPVRFAWTTIRSIVPDLCWMLTAYIIYRSVPSASSSVEPAAEPPPEFAAE